MIFTVGLPQHRLKPGLRARPTTGGQHGYLGNRPAQAVIDKDLGATLIRSLFADAKPEETRLSHRTVRWR